MGTAKKNKTPQVTSAGSEAQVGDEQFSEGKDNKLGVSPKKETQNPQTPNKQIKPTKKKTTQQITTLITYHLLHVCAGS